MAFDLLEECWIPVRRRKSGVARIAPWQLVEDYVTDPVMSLDFPRADLNGGVVQWLIGLLQTAYAPSEELDWRDLWHEPPKAEELRRALGEESGAFLLDGDGPRFMQDRTLTAKEAGETSPVAALLVETPGENAEKNNTDLFIKRGQAVRMCPSCAAAALYTLQTNAPAGGVGHRTGLRGGGPLTTLVLGPKDDTLWRTLWANVLPADAVQSWVGNHDAPRAFGVYPWLAPTRTSEKGQRIEPIEVHPLHAYWGMPRRIRLVFENGEAAACQLCGLETEASVSRFHAKNYGNNYSGTWRHPLSPYTEGKDALIALKGTPDGVGFRLWHGAVASEPDVKNGRVPALVVSYCMDNRPDDLDPKSRRIRLWAFGPDMDKMKARSWAEGIMPVLTSLPGMDARQYHADVLKLVAAAEAAVKALRQAVRYGLLPKLDAKFDASLLQGVALLFWAATEQPFYAAVDRLHKARAAAEDTEQLRRGWLAALHTQAIRIYRRKRDELMDWRMAPEQAVVKEVWLERKLSPGDKELANILYLPAPLRKPGKGGGKAA